MLKNILNFFTTPISFQLHIPGGYDWGKFKLCIGLFKKISTDKPNTLKLTTTIAFAC